MKPKFWTSYFKILVEPHYEGNDDEFAKYCQTPRKHRFQQFAVLNIKVAPNPILAQNMANLHNTVTGLLFTVFRWSICAYYVNNNLEFLL